MLNNARFQIVAVFLITVMIALGMLFIVASPFEQQPIPSPPPADPCSINPGQCYTPYIEPTLTARPLDPQCGRNDEAYQVRYLKPAGQSAPTEYATYTSPDGRRLFYKAGDDVFIRKEDGESLNIGSDAMYSDIVGRVFWSPNSRYVLLTPNMDNHPMLADAETGKTTVLTEVPRAIDFQGWSPDGNSFLFGNDDYQTVSIWSADSGKQTYITKDNFRNFQWSPDGRWIVYFWNVYNADNNRGTQEGITLAAADGSAEYRSVLMEPGQNSIYDSSEPQPLFWSGDSRFVAVRSYTQANGDYREKLVVVKTDGHISTYETTPFKLNEPVVKDVLRQVRWLLDGSRFSFAQLTGENQFAWMLYDTTSQQVTPLYPNLVKPPFFSPSGQQVGLYAREGETFTIAITNPEHSRDVPFIEGASDAGDPDWSPDESWVAAVWAQMEGSVRRVKLSWMHPDGSERHDLDADFKDVRELRWMDGGRKLAYIAWRGDSGNSIETVDTTSGERRVLASDLSTVENPVYDAEHDTLAFWWELADGRYGKDSYRSDGTRVEHFYAAGDFERSRKEFWSPDGSVVALKLGALPYRGLYDQMLVLAYRDGRRPMIVRSGLDGLGDPLWSPDSRQVVFTQWVQDSNYGLQPPALFILSNGGKVIWYDWDFELISIEWAACG